MATPPFTAVQDRNLFQALSLDVSILEALLQRHRNSHGRAIYFRRLSMALQALQRSQLLTLSTQLQSLQSKARQVQHSEQQRTRRSTRPDDAWDRRDDNNDDYNTNIPPEVAALQESFALLQRQSTVQLWQVVDRIEHASRPLWLEVSRGFFLPFCTVALAAIARIRTCVLRLGRSSLSQLHALATEWEVLTVASTKKALEEAMTQFLEKEQGTATRNGWATKEEERTRLVLTTLGYATPVDATKALRGQQDSQLPSTNSERSSAMDEDQTSEQDYVLVEDHANNATGSELLDSRMTSTEDESEPRCNDDDDIGESVAFHVTPALDRRSKASSASSVKNSMDRNLDLVANFKSKTKSGKNVDTTKAKKVHNDNSSKNTDKKSKKRKESISSSKPEKKKKKKKAKDDFFDALFD